MCTIGKTVKGEVSTGKCESEARGVTGVYQRLTYPSHPMTRAGKQDKVVSYLCQHPLGLDTTLKLLGLSASTLTLVLNLFIIHIGRLAPIPTLVPVPVLIAHILSALIQA